jgi:hypothetical protein
LRRFARSPWRAVRFTHCAILRAALGAPDTVRAGRASALSSRRPPELPNLHQSSLTISTIRLLPREISQLAKFVAEFFLFPPRHLLAGHAVDILGTASDLVRADTEILG